MIICCKSGIKNLLFFDLKSAHSPLSAIGCQRTLVSPPIKFVKAGVSVFSSALKFEKI